MSAERINGGGHNAEDDGAQTAYNLYDSHGQRLVKRVTLQWRVPSPVRWQLLERNIQHIVMCV